MENQLKDRSSPIAMLRRLFMLLSDTQFEGEVAVERLRRATLKKAPIITRKRPPPPPDERAARGVGGDALHDEQSSSTGVNSNSTADSGAGKSACSTSPDGSSNKKLKTNSVSRVTLPCALTAAAKEKNDAVVVIDAAAPTLVSAVPPSNTASAMASGGVAKAAVASASAATVRDRSIVHQRWEYNFQELQAFERKYGEEKREWEDEELSFFIFTRC
jgi:hypothetical protein